MSDDSVEVEEAQLDIQQLDIDEIEHELIIRGIESTEGDDKAVKLQEVLEQKWLRSELKKLDLNQELVTLNMKLAELSNLLHDATEGDINLGADSRAVSLYIHCYLRIRREMCLDVNMFAEYKHLIRKLNLAFAKLDGLCENLLFPKIVDSDDEEKELEELDRRKKRLAKERQERAAKQEAEKKKAQKNAKSKKKKETPKNQYREVPVHFPSDSEHSKSEREDSDEDIPSTPKGKVKTERDSSKPKQWSAKQLNPVTKWSYRFSGIDGDKNGDVYSFLDDLEEAAEAHTVPDTMLLNGVIMLLTDEAHTWYKAKKKTITSWDMFKNEIKEAFDPDQDDEKILDKINQLKQTSNQTFVVYEAKFQELLQKLKKPLSDTERLRKILKGLHIFYRAKIVSADISSLRELRTICKKLEKDKKAVMQLQKEERRKEKKKDEKEDRREKKHHKVAAMDIESTDDEMEVSAAVARHSYPKKSNKPEAFCWRCQNRGHYANNCPTAVFCKNCGQSGISTENCNLCKGVPFLGNQQGSSQGGTLAPWYSIPPPPTTSQLSKQQGTDIQQKK